MLASNKKKLFIALACIAAIVLLVVIIVLFNVTNNDQDESIDEAKLTLVEERRTTPALEIYASLEAEEITLAELEASARAISQDIVVAVYQNGSGQLDVAGQPGAIIFDYGPMDEEDTMMTDTESENESLTEEVVIDTEEDLYASEPVVAIEYQPNDTIRNIRYVYQLGDDHYSIGYSKDNQNYIVSDLNEVFEFNRKQDAIKAYLSPVVRWEE